MRSDALLLFSEAENSRNFHYYHFQKLKIVENSKGTRSDKINLTVQAESLKIWRMHVCSNRSSVEEDVFVFISTGK